MLRSRTMATTMSTKQSDSVSVEKESMFKRVIRKLKNKGSSEDSLDIGAMANPTDTSSTEPALQDLKERTEALLENLHGLQSLFQQKHHYTSLMIRRLQEQTTENHKQEDVILSEFVKWLEANNTVIQHLEKTLQDRVSLKDQEVSELKARVADLQSEKTQESTEAAAKTRELEVRLVDQAANTRHRISQKDQEIESLKARVAELEAEKKGFDEARPNMLSQTLQAKNVLIDPRPILQEIQKIRKSNDERMAHQQEMVRKLRKQVEANKGFVKQLKQDLTEQIEPHGEVLKETPDTKNHKEAVQKAAEVPQILLNGVPLLDAEEQEEAVQKAAEVPQILINGVPLLDAEEQEEAVQKAAEVPQILLNGVPLLDAEQQDKVEKKAASMPQQFLSGFSLPNDGNSERSDIPHCIPESPTNESEKEEDTIGMGLASQQNTSLSAGDASIETTLTTVQQPLRIPEFFVVHNFPRSLVAHRLPPNCAMDPVPLQVHFVPNDGCASGEIYYDLDSWADAFEAAMDAMDSGLGDSHRASLYPARKSASFPAQACSTHVLDDWLKPFDSRQRDSIISRSSLKDLPTKSEVGSGDMKPQSPGAPSSWWKPEKPTKYQEFGEPSMNLLDFTAADEPRGLEVLIEKKAPCQFWCAPALVRGDEPRGLELVQEDSKYPQAIQQKAWQRYQPTNMAAVSGQKMSHSTTSMQVTTSPATEGEDTVRDKPVTFEPCFLLALLTHRIKRGYRLSTVLY